MRKLSLLLAFLIYYIGNAQWTDDYEINTLVASGPTEDIQSVGTNDGKTYVIFWDISNGYELRAQLLDENGEKMLGENGILVNSIAQNGSYTVTRDEAVDAESNLYIAFTATADGNGYVHKISTTGEQLFGESGIIIPEAYDMKIVATNNGGAIVGWYKNGFGYLMRYDSTGSEEWAEPIEITSPNSSEPFTSVGEMAVLSDDSVFVLFHTRSLAWNPNSIMWGQRISASGEEMWGAPVQLSTQTTMFNRRYQIIQDDDVIYLGYHGSTGTRFDSFLQKINPDGNLPWNIDGRDFRVDENFYEMTTSIVLDGDYVWATAQVCNTFQSQYGQFVQKFDKNTGERLLTENGLEIFPVSVESKVQVGELQIVESHPLFLFSTDISNGVNPIQLGVILLKPDGSFYWDEQYKMIAASTGNKGNYTFTKNIDSQSVAIWTEKRGDNSHAYAQNIIIDLPTANVNDINSFSVKVYPNPTSGMLQIQSEKPIRKVEVIGLNGQTIQQERNSKSIDISSLPKGVYLLKVTDGQNKTQTTKVIKR